MKPVKFPEVNAVFGEGQPQYEPLPVCLSPEGQVISCWELSEDEKARVAETGQIWLSHLTFNRPLQPVFMTTDKTDLIKPAAVDNQEEPSDGQ